MNALWIICVLCVVTCSLATELCYIHKWNINCIEVDDSGHASASKKLLDHSALYPYGLSYGTVCNNQCTSYLFFTETVLSKGTLLAVPVDDWQSKAPYAGHALKSLIKRDFRSPLPAKLEYDQSLKSVYVTSKRTENAIFSSNISPNMTKSSVHPSALINASNGTVVDISVDHCNRMLYWIEEHDNQTTLFKRSLTDFSYETQKVLTSKLGSDTPVVGAVIPDQLMKTVHFDGYSNSVFVSFTGPSNATTFGRIATGCALELLPYSLQPSYPFDLTSDEKFLYWSDWAVGGVMRVAKWGGGEATMVANASSYTHGGKYWYPGAMELVVLADPMDACEVYEVKGRGYVSTAAAHSLPPNEEHSETFAVKTQGGSHSRKEQPVKKASYGVHEGRDSLYYVTQITPPSRKDGISRNMESFVYSVVSENSVRSEQRAVSAVGESMVRVWGARLTSSEVSSVISFLLVAVVFLCVIVVVLLCLKCPLAAILPPFIKRRHMLVEEQKFDNGAFSGIGGGNDVLVDLTDGEKHTCGISGHATKPKRKIFRPNKERLGKLVPKPSSDGVTINIEDCCQMTLCDQPCFTSLRKEGRPYLTSSKGDQKSLLSDHTTC